MSVRFGLVELPGSVARAVEAARLAEQSGFDWFGVADSQSVYRELYVTLAMCAHATSRLHLGPTVTNPITRHPAVAASAMVSLEDIAPGRTFFGMSSGDSAILNVGERPARRADVREYFQTLRSLWETGKAVHRGNPINASWSGRPVPLYLAAEGPKTLELAGEVADGVIINAGLQPEFTTEAIARIRQGAHRVGRDHRKIDVWTLVRVNVCDDVDAGIDAIKMELASNAHHAFRFTHESKQIPDHLTDAVRRVQRAYEPAEHDYIGGANAKIIEQEPELLQYMAERFAVVGSPQACAAKLRRVVDSGVTNLLFTGYVEDRPNLIRVLGEEVLPRLRATQGEP